MFIQILPMTVGSIRKTIVEHWWCWASVTSLSPKPFLRPWWTHVLQRASHKVNPDNTKLQGKDLGNLGSHLGWSMPAVKPPPSGCFPYSAAGSVSETSTPKPLRPGWLWLFQHQRGLRLELPFSFAVTKSKCPSYVGVTGILLQETKHVFKIITKEDRLKGT